MKWYHYIACFFAGMFLLGCSAQVSRWPKEPDDYQLMEMTSKIGYPFVRGDTTFPLEHYVVDTLTAVPVPDQAERKRLYGGAHFNAVGWLRSPDTCTFIAFWTSRHPGNEVRVHELVFMRLNPPDWTLVSWHVGH